MAKLSRYSSLSALTAFALAPLVFFLLGDSLWLVGANGLMTLTLFLTHHENLARLIQGTEKRIGEKPAST
jgi:glycerol-3-phosphate acyltransferase PlsY